MNHHLETRVSAFSLAALVTLVLMGSINQLATSPAPEQLLAHADRSTMAQQVVIIAKRAHRG